MHSFSELIFGAAEKTSGQGLGLSEAFTQGAQLALKKRAVEQKKQDLDIKRKQMNQAKITKFYDYIQGASQYESPAARNNYLKSAIGFRDSLGLDKNKFSDDMIKSLGYDESQGRLRTINRQLANGSMDPKEAEEIITNPKLFAKVDPTPIEAAGSGDVNLQKTIETRLDREAAQKRAEIMSQQRTQDRSPKSVAEREMAKKMAADHADFLEQGGIATIEANARRLGVAYRQLISGKVKTGTGVLKIIGGS